MQTLPSPPPSRASGRRQAQTGAASTGSGRDGPVGCRAPWAAGAAEVLAALGSRAEGLSDDEAARRRDPSSGAGQRSARGLRLLVGQLRSPASALLATSAVLAGLLGDRTDATVILSIVAVSVLLGFWQERGAAGAVDRLLRRLRDRATVVRAGSRREIDAAEVVPGDVLVLEAGSSLAADARVLSSNCLYMDEAPLTGESYPAEKSAGAVPAEAALAGRSDMVFAGTHVVSGAGTGVAVAVGRATVLGGVAAGLAHEAPPTAFERGVRRFGYLLLEITLVLVVVVLGINVLRGRPPLEALLFTLALAVGLAPEMLPAIVSVTLAHGARRMAAARVIVRRLVSIEDFGAMTVLCTDKTGTLTQGGLRLDAAADVDGRASERVFLHAYLNAALQSAFPNPLDEAIRACPAPDVSAYRKAGEAPYDFTRKRLGVAVEHGGGRLLVVKGALPSVLAACDTAETARGVRPLADVRSGVEARFEALSRAGFRCLGVAVRALDPGEAVAPAAERAMTFLGTLSLEDPLRADAAEAVTELRALGIETRMLTGDNRHVAAAVAERVGLGTRMLTAGELRALSEAALVRRAPRTDVFAELDPHDKERVLRALRRSGAVVGYLGDGINDAGALHAADVGISVDSAVDVARQAASVVLLDKSLRVVAAGVREGRRAFGNTLKYVFITMSANFGNMFSMAVASLFSAFLPLLPRQILLINALSDIPALAIAADRLDPSEVALPRRWDVRFVRDFMLLFGLVSSAFDLATFGVLRAMGAGVAEFRTAWFLESMASELLILLVIRTRGSVLRSRPGAGLAWSSAAVAVVTVALPYVRRVAEPLGFVPVSGPVLAAMAAVTLAYAAVSEAAKHAFYRRQP